MEPLRTIQEKRESEKQFENRNILVCIRVRPTLKREFEKEICVDVAENGKGITINARSNIIQASFDRAFGPNSTQSEVYEAVAHYVPGVLKGFHSTIFAYGQTGSGKTHTIFGSDWESLIGYNGKRAQQTYVQDIDNDSLYVGVIPRMINQIFKQYQAKEFAAKRLAIYCSFLQIYNEKIYDLLQDRYGNNSLNIRENKFDGIYVEGLTEFSVFSFEECISLMKRGERNRFTRQTTQNVKSSRSHTIFQLLVESTIADSNGKLQKAKLNICDLAGSEKLKKQEDVGVEHMKELKGINLSLTILGKVIQSLSSKSNLPVPYRESKLTRLLQDSLGGNTQTCLIATLTPTAECADETINTMKFAERARLIVTKVSQNQINATDAELVQKLKKEVISHKFKAEITCCMMQIEYLREILSMRRQGTSAIGEVHQKLIILKEENERLRQNHISIQEVEKLLAENKTMKFELQKLKNESCSDLSPDRPLMSIDTNFRSIQGSEQSTPMTPAESLLLRLSSLTSSGLNRNISTPLLQPLTLNSTRFSEVKLRNFDALVPSELLTSRDTFKSDPAKEIHTARSISKSNGRTPTSRAGMKPPVRFPDIRKTEVNVRIRGKSQVVQTTGILERTLDEQKRLEEKRKAKARAIDRLKDLQRIQEHNKLKLEEELTSIESIQLKRPTRIPMSVRSQSTPKNSEKPLYNPYKVRTDIEQRYFKHKRQDPLSKRPESQLNINQK